jgi:hypothetical protein
MFASRQYVWGHRDTGCKSGTVPGKTGRMGTLVIVENICLSHPIVVAMTSGTFDWNICFFLHG